MSRRRRPSCRGRARRSAATVSGRRHVRRLRIPGMDCDPRDRLALLQPDVCPITARVRGQVHPVAPARAVAVVGLAAAHPDHLGIGRGHGHGAHRGHRLFLEDALEGAAVVGGLHHAAGAQGHVEGVRVLRIEGDVRHPPAHDRGPDAAGLQGLEREGVDPGTGGSRGGGGGLGRGLALGKRRGPGEYRAGDQRRDDGASLHPGRLRSGRGGCQRTASRGPRRPPSARSRWASPVAGRRCRPSGARSWARAARRRTGRACVPGRPRP